MHWIWELSDYRDITVSNNNVFYSRRKMSSYVKVIRPTGIIDSTCGNQLRREISDLVEAKQINILIDCKEVEFMDSSGLSCLIMSLKKAREAGGYLGLSNVNGQLKLLLELTAMDNVLQVFAGPAAFIQSNPDMN
jgi:anti-sigma B factor antagonist